MHYGLCKNGECGLQTAVLRLCAYCTGLYMEPKLEAELTLFSDKASCFSCANRVKR